VEGNYFSGVAPPGHATRRYAPSQPGRQGPRANEVTGTGAGGAGGGVVEPRTYYAYTLDTAGSVPALVASGAGAGRG
jgi:pectate lyase